MASSVTRRCGCRDSEGQRYTASRPCPELARNPRHGAWAYRVSAGTVADPKPGAPGHRKRRYLTGSGFERKRDAEEALAKALRAYRGQGDALFDKTTIGDYLAGWIERRSLDLKPSTAFMYRRYLDEHIVPALGEKRLVKLSRADVAAFVDHLRTKTVRGQDFRQRKLGDVTVRRIHAVLRSALSEAVRRGLIEANPASMADLPNESRRKVRVWEQADALRFLDAVKGHRLGPLFEFAISTGLRRGEICGLRWADVDLVEGRITVRVNLVDVGGQAVEGAPKTRAGDGRELYVSADVVDILARVKDRTEAERAAWGDAWTDSGRVFVHEDGRQLRPGYPSKVMEKTVRRLGLPAAHFHSLRHQFASIQIDMGTELTLLSKMMGHATSAITSDTYSHMFAARERKQMNATSAWLRGAAPVPAEPANGA